jgi:hypothetical protein
MRFGYTMVDSRPNPQLSPFRSMTMFRKFFSALANLVNEVENLTSSVREANKNFRSNLALDYEGEPEQIGHTEGVVPGSSNGQGRRHKATTK